MKTLYLDLVSGISGDMFLGALIDLGLDLAVLERELGKLELTGYHLHARRDQRAHLTGVKFDVHLHSAHDHGHSHAQAPHEHPPAHSHVHHHPPVPDHAHEADEDHDQHGETDHDHSNDHEHADHEHDHEHGRTFADIRQLIRRSPLSPWVQDKAIAVFARVAMAEGAIHGQAPEQVTFHEVGAVDSIIDIVGACVALEQLGKPRVLSSPVVDGTGWVRCAHGPMPLPAPATLAILGARGIPLTQCDEPHELVTPTGAALLAELVEQFGPMCGLVAHRIGHGLGRRENQTRPNVLRAILSEDSPSNPDWETDTVMVLETNLDDISAEILGGFTDKALAAGALDVFHTPIQMKKNRPGVLLTVLCLSADADRFTELLLRETGTFGVRRHAAERRKLRRRILEVATPWGSIPVKVGELNGQVLQAKPEYEACQKVAQAHGLTLKHVIETTFHRARSHLEANGGR